MEPEPISLQLQQPSPLLAPSLNPLSIPTTAPEFTAPVPSDFEEKFIAMPSAPDETGPYRLETTQFRDCGEVQVIVRGEGFQEGSSTVGKTLYTPSSAISGP